MQNAHLIVPDIACNSYFLTILSYEKTDANFANLIFPTKKGFFFWKLKKLFSKHLAKLFSFETHLKTQYFFTLRSSQAFLKQVHWLLLHSQKPTQPHKQRPPSRLATWRPKNQTSSEWKSRQTSRRSC